MGQSLNNKVLSATKWSAITEVAAKLVAPVSTMVLARILTPDAFGVLITATMVISFAEIFTDAGFQKYIVQHEFESEDSLFKSTAVAFWSNLFFSLFIWAIICIFSKQIAHLVGSDGYGVVIAVSCVCIPLAAFSSIQMALFKRFLDFKTLFWTRIVGILIPIICTIPLALLTRSYWSLIIGMIALNLSNAILLTFKSPWKPEWFYDIKLFKEMFSFTMWSMIEAISIWLTTYLDVFIVGTMLSAYYIGIYRTSINTVNSIMFIITNATTPVLFSALSRLQDNVVEYKKLFFKFQKFVSILVIPLGVGIFIFNNFVTDVLLGSQWGESAYLIGWWGLTSAITIVLSHYASEVYRSLGKPKLSFVSQMLQLIFLIPVVLIAVQYDFNTLCVSRSFVRLVGVVINAILLYKLVRLRFLDMLKTIWPACAGSLVMFVEVSLLPESDGLITQVGYIVLCTASYFATICLFKEERDIISNIKTYLKKQK